jgi:MEMO1 family protein
MNTKPKLRLVDMVPALVKGQKFIALKDPLQVCPNTVGFPENILPLLLMFNGANTMLDIQEALTRQSGRLVFMDQITAVVSRLDELYLLETTRFEEALARKVADYRELPFRPASHAGMSYSADPEALKAELDSYFSHPKGPGMPGKGSLPDTPKGLIAPHIDVKSGGPVFAHAYSRLAQAKPADLYVILGTGHAGVRDMFTATSLDFQTPLGTVKTDKDFVANLSRQLGRDCAGEEILHAAEHVIEFQLIFLQHVLGNDHRYQIVPILCAISHHYFDGDGEFTGKHSQFKDFCAALKAVCKASGKSVTFIASADWDHIGPRYGDSFIPDHRSVAGALERDRGLIVLLERMDVENFTTGIIRQNDSARICGFSPIVTMLHTMEAEKGELLSLDYTTVDDRNSFVTYASMVFE